MTSKHVRRFLGLLTVAAVATLLTPGQSQAMGHRKASCYTPCYTYCYTPCYTTCYTPPYCPPMKEYCVVYRYDPCYCTYVFDSYAEDEGKAKERVEGLKKAGYYAYYCCYEINYVVYSYDAAKCSWVQDKIFGKGEEQKAKDRVKELLEKGPATYLPFLHPRCVY